MPKLRKYVPETPAEGLRVGEYQDVSGYYIGQWLQGVRTGKVLSVTLTTINRSRESGSLREINIRANGRTTNRTGLEDGRMPQGLHAQAILKTERHVSIARCTSNEKDGLGSVKTLDGTKWTGKFSRGIRKGNGKIIYSNGDVFQVSVELHLDSDSVQGVWKNDRIHGDGRLTCKNGLIYVGEWQNNAFHGVGKLTLSVGVTYEGNFVKGRIQGRGCYKYPDETVYVGDVEDSLVCRHFCTGLIACSDMAKENCSLRMTIGSKETGNSISLTAWDGRCGVVMCTKELGCEACEQDMVG